MMRMVLLTCERTSGSHFSDCSLNVVARMEPLNYTMLKVTQGVKSYAEDLLFLAPDHDFAGKLDRYGM